jgi:hypothetical protein
VSVESRSTVGRVAADSSEVWESGELHALDLVASVHPSQHRVLSTVAAMQVSCGDETESVNAASHE